MPTPQRTAPPATLAIVALTILGALAQVCFTASRGRHGHGAAGNAAERNLQVTRVTSPLVARLAPLNR